MTGPVHAAAAWAGPGVWLPLLIMLLLAPLGAGIILGMWIERGRPVCTEWVRP